MRLASAAILFSFLALLSSCRTGKPSPPGGPLQKSVETGVKERVGVGITVLNKNLALVREVRKVDLKEGRQVLSFGSVSDEIIPESVRVISNDEENPLFFEEQNYDTDLIEPKRLIEKGVGQKVRAYTVNSATGEEEEIAGVLLSGEDGILIQTDDGVREVPTNARIEMDDIPKSLRSEPSLSWITGALDTDSFEIAASYLTRGLSWSADYVIDVDQESQIARIQAWATINNRTALALENAGLQLLAGEVNVAKQEVKLELMMFQKAEGDAAAPPMPTEESLFEYHLYTVERPLTIRARQQKQITLTSADGVAFKVVHKMQLTLTDYSDENLPTALLLEIEHEEGTPLGMPLPEGKAAVWTEDRATGNRLQVGEVKVDHTPVGEPWKIELQNDPAISGAWVPARARWENERYLVEGSLHVKNNRATVTKMELNIGVRGSPDISMFADGEEVASEQAGVWKLEIELEPNETRTIAVQTRL